MALTPLHVRDVCYGSWPQNQPTCKYLLSMARSDGQWIQVCTKHAGTPPAPQHSGATGDNCKGYLLLHFKQQGYDVDKK